jgi:hypothetical protein
MLFFAYPSFRLQNANFFIIFTILTRKLLCFEVIALDKDVDQMNASVVEIRHLKLCLHNEKVRMG